MAARENGEPQAEPVSGCVTISQRSDAGEQCEREQEESECLGPVNGGVDDRVGIGGHDARGDPGIGLPPPGGCEDRQTAQAAEDGLHHGGDPDAAGDRVQRPEEERVSRGPERQHPHRHRRLGAEEARQSVFARRQAGESIPVEVRFGRRQGPPGEQETEGHSREADCGEGRSLPPRESNSRFALWSRRSPAPSIEVLCACARQASFLGWRSLTHSLSCRWRGRPRAR